MQHATGLYLVPTSKNLKYRGSEFCW